MDNTGYGMKMMMVMIIIPCILGLFFVEFGRCDINDALKQCSDRLATVATCLPFAQGDGSRPPSKDCCSGFKSALENKPVCICYLFLYKDDPSLGITVNVTTGLTLPERCKITTNRSLSECPGLLNLPPNSPDAKVFAGITNTTPKSSVASPSPATHGGSISAPASVQATVPHSGVNRRQPSRFQTVSLVVFAVTFCTNLGQYLNDPPC